MKDRLCEWCKQRIPTHKRAGARFCDKKCKQAKYHDRIRAQKPTPKARQALRGDEVQVGVLLPGWLRHRLERESDSRNECMSVIVRDALTEYFRVRDLV